MTEGPVEDAVLGRLEWNPKLPPPLFRKPRSGWSCEILILGNRRRFTIQFDSENPSESCRVNGLEQAKTIFTKFTASKDSRIRRDTSIQLNEEGASDERESEDELETFARDMKLLELRFHYDVRQATIRSITVVYEHVDLPSQRIYSRVDTSYNYEDVTVTD